MATPAAPSPAQLVALIRRRPNRTEKSSEKKRLPDLIDFIQANEPRLMAFNEYANEEGTEVAVVQVHPDADSMAFHMKRVVNRRRGALEAA